LNVTTPQEESNCLSYDNRKEKKQKNMLNSTKK